MALGILIKRSSIRLGSLDGS